jgi:pimeloyl-ACP methyl ester carboxylesterase
MSAMMSSYTQQKRSWYMFFFQQPIAETAVQADDFAFIERLWRDWSPGLEPPADLLAEVRASLSAPGSLEAALGYYRATFNPLLLDPALAALQDRITASPIPVPSLYLHGADDGCIGKEIVAGMEAFFPAGLETEIVPGAGHFLHLEAPEVVAKPIGAFLKK